MLSPAPLAFYGKLPWVGDFIARNIEYSQQQQIDQWLVAGFSALQEENPDWLDNYLLAPVWNFMIPAGVWTDTRIVGALMPSVDRVGRYFPFVVFFELDCQMDLVMVSHQLTALATIIPELLQCELVADDIHDFIAAHLNQATKNFSENNYLVAMDFDSLPCFSNEKSYWRKTQDGIIVEFDYAPSADAPLFKRLFGGDF